MAISDSQDRLNTIVDQAENKIRSEYISIINRLKNSKTIQDYEDIVDGRRTDLLNDDIKQSGLSIAAIILSSAYINAGLKTSEFLSRSLNDTLIFDQFSDHAINYGRSNSFRISNNFFNEQASIISDIISNGISNGYTVSRIAGDLRGSIGLTDRQYQFIENARRQLENNDASYLDRILRDRRFDRTVVNSIQNGQRLSPDQIDRIVDRYRERFVAYRARTIARTETVRAVNAGVLEQYRQAVDSGKINKDAIMRTWRTRKDIKVRDSHISMEGQEQRYGDSFISGDGNLLRYPADVNAPAYETINCRCVVTTTIDTSI